MTVKSATLVILLFTCATVSSLQTYCRKETVEKPGSCPPPDDSGYSGCLRTYMCINDNNCPDDLKCCPNACGGTDCKETVPEEDDVPLDDGDSGQEVEIQGKEPIAIMFLILFAILCNVLLFWCILWSIRNGFCNFSKRTANSIDGIVCEESVRYSENSSWYRDAPSVIKVRDVHGDASLNIS